MEILSDNAAIHWCLYHFLLYDIPPLVFSLPGMIVQNSCIFSAIVQQTSVRNTCACMTAHLTVIVRGRLVN